MKKMLDYNRDGKVSTLERARAFSLLMMAMEEQKDDDWGDYDEFYSDVDEIDEPAGEEASTVDSTYVQPPSRPNEQQLEKEYQDAVCQMRIAKSSSDYLCCSILFSLLDGYKDSEQCSKLCEYYRQEAQKKENRRSKLLGVLTAIGIYFLILLAIAAIVL